VGLDIVAYTRLSPINADEPDGVTVYVNPDFPSRASEFKYPQRYEAEECFDFRAGSYSGYVAWREELAKLAGYPAVKDDSERLHGHEERHSHGAWAATGGPFWELINFSDCEGALGTSTCVKLLRDFVEYGARAQAIGGWFYDRYQLWHKAMFMGADRGAVCFH
jgi:hypothetical protein